MPKKATKKSPVAEKKTEKAAPEKPERFVEGVGRRKTAIARVRLTSGGKYFSVNGKSGADYFAIQKLFGVAAAPLARLKIEKQYDVSAKVFGGGKYAQAEAVRLGLARALTVKNPAFKARLRKLGYLTRDSRMVERKKYGLKKARRAPQWQKR